MGQGAGAEHVWGLTVESQRLALLRGAKSLLQDPENKTFWGGITGYEAVQDDPKTIHYNYSALFLIRRV